MRRFFQAIKESDLTPEKVLKLFIRAIQEDDLAPLENVPCDLVNEWMKNGSFPMEGETLLMRACTEGSTKMVRYLFSFPSIELNRVGPMLLRIACEEGHSEIVEFLLEHSDIDVNKDTPLYWACRMGHFNVVRRLLESGLVDINRDRDNHSPLYAACKKGYLGIVRLLLRQPGIDVNGGVGKSPLYAACGNGHLEIVRLLLEQSGIDVNKGDSTPLYAACCIGNLEIVRLLLEQSGIDVNKGVYTTPLYTACLYGRLEIVNLLLEQSGIDVNKGDKTPLCGACRNGHSEIVKLLLERTGIDVIKGDKTPLYAACKKGHLEIVQLLLSNGATTDEKTREMALSKGISLEQLLTTPSSLTLALPSTTDEVLALDKPHLIERQTLGPLAPILKKCEWDLLDGSTDWYVFKPLLRLSKIIFTQHTLGNDKFMQWISDTGNNSMERGAMKHLVECFLYGDEWPMPTHWSEWLALLFLIDSSASEWPKLTALCAESLTELVDMKMAAILIKSIHKYQQLAELFPVKMKESLLSKLERYTFSYIATQCREESMQTVYRENILSDPYFEPYYKVMNHLNRLDKISIETPPSEVTHLGWHLLFNREDGDLELADRSTKCHRTILCTVSANFETYFNDWNNQKAVESPVMIHIVRYCYGVGGEIAASDLVPLMLLSHDLAMYDLFELAQSQVTISTDNFFELLQQLEDYTGELSMEPLIERLIEFGIEHANDLFIPRNIPLLRGSIIDLIRLRK